MTIFRVQEILAIVNCRWLKDTLWSAMRLHFSMRMFCENG